MILTIILLIIISGYYSIPIPDITPSHTRDHTHEHPLENATESPSELSSKNPLDK